MQSIELVAGLSIKKLEPKNEKDIWLIQQMTKDPEVNRYIDSYKTAFIDTEYLTNTSLYQAPYSIWTNNHPIGYLEISRLFRIKKFVDLTYAILPDARGKKYAQTVLQAVSTLLLEELNRVQLIIDINNKSSKRVAEAAHFVVQQSENSKYYTYQKTKINML